MLRHLPAVSIGAVLLLLAMDIGCKAEDSSTGGNDTSSPDNSVVDYFKDWFSRVSKAQAEQPHWVTPLVTVTPRLEEEIRYDQMIESVTGGQTLTNYGGGGGKGLELIPFDPVEIIVGIPSWQTVDSKPPKDGWTDESFLVKCRFFAANEEGGNYILTAFMGLTVPNGSDNTTSHHFVYSPTIAFGKGFGDFAAIAVNFLDGSKWFLPFDFLIGKKFVLQNCDPLEVSVPLVKDYNSYEFKLGSPKSYFY